MNLESREEVCAVTWRSSLALTLPFLLNDFSNIFVRDYRLWLAIDYIFVKAVPLALLACLLRAREDFLCRLGTEVCPGRLVHHLDRDNDRAWDTS